MLLLLLLVSTAIASPDGTDAVSSILSNQSLPLDSAVPEAESTDGDVSDVAPTDGSDVSEVVPSVHSDPPTSFTAPLEVAFSQLSDEPSEQVKKEVWGEWTVVTPCTNDCGACGRIHLIRECLCAGEDDCPCSDRETRVEVCATKLCQFPRSTCCHGFVKVATYGGFRCAATGQSAERICEGQWTPWAADSSAGTCSSPCGMCGKRRIATRKCEPEGCECTGTDTELFEPCNSTPCKEGKECCEGFIKGQENGREECVQNSPLLHTLPVAARKFIDAKREKERKEILKRKAQFKSILTVLDSPSACNWGEWVDVDSECSASCGMCGVRLAARRTCQPAGCNCSGSSVRYEDCGEGICDKEDKPCCGFYTKSSLSGVPTCIDEAADVKEYRPARRAINTLLPLPQHQLSTSTCRGIWSPFVASPASACDKVCGLCGHRVVAERRCIPEGCMCEGSAKLLERCGDRPCWDANMTCCPGASIVLVDGRRTCKEDK